MQTIATQGLPSHLSQGHIFRIANVRFAKGAHQKKFDEFYPEVDLNGVDYGVVLTQACDLEHSKVTHITIGLLETPPKSGSAILGKSFLEKVFCKIDGRGFWNSVKLAKTVGQELGNLIQNREAALLFLTLDVSGNDRHYVVNLSKLFPIKIHHEAALRSHVSHEIVGDFRALLGWKLANLYGRVGVTEYSDERTREIATALADELVTELKSEYKKKESVTDFTEIPKEEDFDGVRKKLKELSQAISEGNNAKTERVKRSLGDKLKKALEDDSTT